jgi:hypothetical protein
MVTIQATAICEAALVDDVVLMIAVAVAVPFGASATLDGEKLTDMPEGTLDAEKVRVPLNVALAETEKEAVPVAPRVRLSVPDELERVKSGVTVAAAVTLIAIEPLPLVAL